MVVPRRERGQNPAYRPSGVFPSALCTRRHRRGPAALGRAFGLQHTACPEFVDETGISQFDPITPHHNVPLSLKLSQNCDSRRIPFDAHVVPWYPKTSHHPGSVGNENEPVPGTNGLLLNDREGRAGRMTQFLGTHQNRLDAKGRVSVRRPFAPR